MSGVLFDFTKPGLTSMLESKGKCSTDVIAPDGKVCRVPLEILHISELGLWPTDMDEIKLSIVVTRKEDILLKIVSG